MKNETPSLAELEAKVHRVCGQIEEMQKNLGGKLPAQGTDAWEQWDRLSKEYQRLAVEYRDAIRRSYSEDPAALLRFIEDGMKALEIIGPEAERRRHPIFRGMTDPLQEPATRKKAVRLYEDAYEHALDILKADPSLPPLPQRQNEPKDNLDALREWCIRAAKTQSVNGSKTGIDTKEHRAVTPQETPKTNSGLIYQVDAATFYNIPKSTLCKDAKKKPGEPGYLWSGTEGRRRFYRKSDLERLSKSRQKLKHV
jgi:hypothetical protein